MALHPAQLRLVLTPSQSPISLQEPGEEFVRVLSQLVGTPVKVDATASFDTASQQYLKTPCRADATRQYPDEERIRQLNYVAET